MITADLTQALGSARYCVQPPDSAGHNIEFGSTGNQMHNIRWLNYCFFLLFIGFAGCQTVEYTGRSQVNLISDSQEKQLGAEAYADILKKTPISNRADWQAQLQRVGQRIAAAAARPDYQWEFKVLQGKEVNAFCLPGYYAHRPRRQRRRGDYGT